MIEKIGHYSITNPATIYDEEALTALELAGRTAAKVNETVDVVNQTVESMPGQISAEVQRQIDGGIFDDQIDTYAGELKEQIEECENTVIAQVVQATEELTARVDRAENDLGTRVNNLLGSIEPGGTTSAMDAEVIAARTDVDGNLFDNIGEAISSQVRRAQPTVYCYQGRMVYDESGKMVKLIAATVENPSLSFTARVGHRTFIITVKEGDYPAEITLTNGMSYCVLNHINKTVVFVAYNAYSYTSGDIILFGCYNYKIWPMALSIMNFYAGDKPLFVNQVFDQRFPITTTLPVLVDLDTNNITIQAGTYLIHHFSNYSTGHTYRLQGQLTTPLTVKVIAKSNTLEYVCYNHNDKTLRVVDRNYNAEKGEYILFSALEGVYSALDLNPSCVTYVNTPAGDPIETDSYRTVSDIISKIVCSERKLKIVLGGDSITHGAGGTGWLQNGEHIITTGGRSWHMNPDGYCWANLFRDYMESNYNVDVVNHGCTGTNSLFWSENKATLIPEDTDIFILSIGTNDRLTSAAVDKAGTLQNYYNNLCDIVDYCHKRGISVILCSPIPATAEQEASASYYCECMHLNGVVQKVAAKYHMGYVNMYNAIRYYMRDKGEQLETYLGDGLHPNDSGYKLMFYETLRAMELSPDIVDIE